MLFSVTMFPVGNGPSIRKPVAEVVEEFDRAGLHYQVGPTETAIEGEWATVMPVIQLAEERLRARHKRVFTLVMVDDHVGAEHRLHGAVDDIVKALHHDVSH